ncbi:serine/threonine protein kinase [Nonomuraea sp. LPB2021202275-12-8]|uniref:serine/threonine protein kinase n=1 Tax=Nonomuraea sp. LPB2021202275-12-8 TaxID=3120159 RepID=UPI00300CB8CA
MPEFEPLREGDPTHVGSYRLVGRLGPDVFVGEHPEAEPGTAGEPVVVKLLHPHVDRERFLKLIEPIQDVSAFCSAQMLGSGTMDGRPYVVSEYIDGPTLEAVTAEGTRLRGAALHRLAVGTVTALVAIHQARTVHGDVRPGNVVLGPDGPRVINVGVARAMAATAETTTRRVEVPAFTAPERLAGAEPAPPADVFSWAATVVSAATGASPFDGGSMASTVNRIANAEPDLPDLGDLQSLIVTCLAKDPARRPTSSDVLLRLVGETRFLTGRLLPPAAPPPYVPPPVAQEPPGPPVRRGRGVLIAVAAFAAGALLAGTGVYTLGPERILAAGPSATRPSPTGSTASGSVITAAPQVTPSTTTAPMASVAPKADGEVELADIGATLHENAADPVRLAAYLQAKRPFKTFARDRTGRFREIGLAEEPRVSPDGTWAALNPWLKFQNSDMDSVRFHNITTGETFSVLTVRKPEETWFPTWSRDGRRLLMSVMDKKRERITGYAVVDVAARKATVVLTQYEDAASLPFTFAPDGSIARGFSSSKRRGIDTYDMSGKVIHSRHWVGTPRDVDWYSPSGKQFITLCPNGDDVCVWDTVSGDRKATIEGIDDGARLLGWFSDDHVLIEEPAKKKGRAEIKVVDFLGKTQRVIADVAMDLSRRQFAAKAP